LNNFYDGLIKLIISLSTGVLGIIPGIDGHDAQFTESEFYVRNNEIFISALIESNFNQRIDDIIRSGRKVRLHITAEIYREQDKKPLKKAALIKTVDYDILEKHYLLSYENTEEFVIYEEKAAMWQNFLTIKDRPVFRAKDFPDKGPYHIQVRAELETDLEISGKNLDLMLFWNNKAPEFTTSAFDNSRFSI